jgi:predicted amidophosphoribosyltransferase
MRVRSLVDDLLDALLPGRCPGCGRLGALVCEACSLQLRRAPSAPPPPPLDWWTACYAYESVARELVARAKYRNERRFLGVVAHELAGAVSSAPTAVDVVTWAPASAARIRVHGLDHGELLARALARVIASAATPSLRREPGPPQTGLDARTRRLGPPLVALGDFAGARMLVVDDVATTGGTLAAAGRALRAARAESVFAATIARTPRPGDAVTVPTYTPPDSAGLRSRVVRERTHR